MNHDTNNYTTNESGWHEASKTEPCPLCGKPDWCFISPDRNAILCRRISNTPDGWKYIKESSDGTGAIYYRIDGTRFTPRTIRSKKLKEKQEIPSIPIETVGLEDIAYSEVYTTINLQKVSDDRTVINYKYDDNHIVTRTEIKDLSQPKGYKKICIPWHRESSNQEYRKGKGDKPWIPYGLEGYRNYQRIDWDYFAETGHDENAPIKRDIVNLLINKWVIGVEGESCVDSVNENIKLATFTVQGGSWDDNSLDFAMDYLSQNYVAGIIYIPDNDEPGYKKAESMAEAAARNGIKFLQLNLRRMWTECPEKGDIADWIATCPQHIDDNGQNWGIDESDRNFVLNAIEAEIKLALREHKRQQKIQNLTAKIAIATETVRDGWEERLRFNTLQSRVELDGKPINQNYLHIEIGYEFGIDVSATNACAIVEAIAKDNSYSPVVEYLNRVATKHENADITIIENLATRYFGTNDPLHNTYLKRTLIAAVARAMQPGCKHDCACVLVGTQGHLKSTFWRYLFGNDWFTDEVGDCSDKDELMKLHRVWAAEIAEFEVVYRRKDISQLKRFMSSQVDDYRPPYGREVEHYPRASVLVGTSNERQILSDPTGNRRFWIVPVTKRIDIESIKKERDLLWASAVKLYTQGEQWWLTDTEEQQREIDNKNYSSTDPWEEMILGHIENQSSVTTTDILLNCVKMDASRMDTASQRRVAAILQENGWKLVRKRENGRQYRAWVAPNCDACDGCVTDIKKYPSQAESTINQDFQSSVTDVTDKTIKKPSEIDFFDKYSSSTLENTSFSPYKDLSVTPVTPVTPPNLTTPPGTFNKGDEVRYVGSEKSRATGKKLVVTGTSADGVWVMRPDRFPDGPFNPNDLEPWGR